MAIAVSGLVVVAASASIVQVIQSSRNSSHMTALRQVQTAGYWVSTDGIQAQQISVPELPGFSFNLTWADWENGEVHQVVYSLEDMPGGLKQLQRQETVVDTGVTTAIITGRYIDSSQTSCEWDGSVLIFKVTAEVMGAQGTQTETRIYEIKPRPFS